MRTRTRLALGVILAAIVPLGLAAAFSIRAARETAQEAVRTGMENTAGQAAGRIEQFVGTQRQILRALARTVAPTSHLTPAQAEAVLRNHVLDFAAFHELALYGADGSLRLELRKGSARALTEERLLARRALSGADALGGYYLDDDLQPGLGLAVPIRGPAGVEGALVAQLELVELWRLTDRIAVGERGYALVADGEGRILAGGNGELKARALLEERLDPATGISRVLAAGTPRAGTRRGSLGEEVLAAEVPIPELGLVVVVEQPTAEAFGGAALLAWTLVAIALLAALGAVGISALGARRPLRTIAGLAAAMERVAGGDFHARASAAGDDELAALARDFNGMAGRLRELHDELRRNERLAVFSRIAAGLAHDLRHPIKNLENQARLATELHDDPGFRRAFARTVEREFATLDRFLQDLGDLTARLDVTIISLDPRELARAAADGVAGQASERGVPLLVEVEAGSPRLLGDRISLERALKNLLVNAIEASPRGAAVRVACEVGAGFVTLAVIDRGPGLSAERQGSLFEEFASSKRSGKGLGLGLALSGRFVREQGGQLLCESEEGRGATFRIRMPLAPAVDLPAGGEATGSRARS